MEPDKKKRATDSSENAKVNLQPAGSHKGHRAERHPEWTNGLRRLYDSVVAEPLPDSFKELLSRLDEKS
ncbi:NepR family anti-sigma factor [Allopontixanthobacter sp.]|uniref:NepR family anti-sigma factor n=1 Tax=Allopontixanthobacter sp. TaxID=2906452 RepID=UPI002AB916B1|nr:NepR family anti-sigma factor [Allopontixanthobacter sp.]MDZ4307618.1 NepR family anti-sigma factor [Allopontixanthobacter sp.]